MDTSKIESIIDGLDHTVSDMKNVIHNELYKALLEIPINKVPSGIVDSFEYIQQYADWMSEDLKDMKDDLNVLKDDSVADKSESKWYMDDDRIRTIMRAVECYFKKHPYEGYEITVDDFERKQDDTHGSVLYISGNVKGVSYYTYNQRDADDYDTKEFSFDLQFCVGGFTGSYFDKTGRINFFKDLIY